MRQSWNRCERDGAAWLLLGNDFEILASAIQPIMVEEDDLMIRWSRQNLPVKIAKSVFAIDFAVSYGVSLPAVAFSSIAPAEF